MTLLYHRCKQQVAYQVHLQRLSCQLHNRLRLEPVAVGRSQHKQMPSRQPPVVEIRKGRCRSVHKKLGTFRVLSKPKSGATPSKVLDGEVDMIYEKLTTRCGRRNNDSCCIRCWERCTRVKAGALRTISECSPLWRMQNTMLSTSLSREG